MPLINIEIKARTSRTDQIRKYLLDNNAEYKGLDVQTDTYFQVKNGRLKIREGKIENNLIFYLRKEVPGMKQSDFQLMSFDPDSPLKDILIDALGPLVIVKKFREIFFIKNVKFHLDYLEGLGNFVEIEASNREFDIPVDQLREQCKYYMDAFEITEADLVPKSYSDMMLELFQDNSSQLPR